MILSSSRCMLEANVIIMYNRVLSKWYYIPYSRPSHLILLFFVPLLRLFQLEKQLVTLRAALLIWKPASTYDSKSWVHLHIDISKENAYIGEIITYIVYTIHIYTKVREYCSECAETRSVATVSYPTLWIVEVCVCRDFVWAGTWVYVPSMPQGSKIKGATRSAALLNSAVVLRNTMVNRWMMTGPRDAGWSVEPTSMYSLLLSHSLSFLLLPCYLYLHLRCWRFIHAIFQ